MQKATPAPTEAIQKATPPPAAVPKAKAIKTTAAGADVLGGVLKGHEKDFEEMGAKHGVDPNLLMAIAEFETGHGTSYSARTRHNIAGIMDGKRHRVYGSIREGIEAQASLLKRGYISQGLTTIPQIGAKYSPPGASNDPNKTNWQWPASVQREYNRIKAASLKETTAALGPRMGSGAGTTNNISMSSPITVNGVAPGKEYAVSRQVHRAIQDPIRQLLDQIKAARNAEARLGYV